MTFIFQEWTVSTGVYISVLIPVYPPSDNAATIPGLLFLWKPPKIGKWHPAALAKVDWARGEHLTLLDQSHSLLWGPESEPRATRGAGGCLWSRLTLGATFRDVLPPSSSEASKSTEIRGSAPLSSPWCPQVFLLSCHPEPFSLFAPRDRHLIPKAQGNVTTRGRVGSWLTLQVPLKLYRPC